ncbi:MAG: hypothetical protein PF495_15075 [Spirochaetales bacterium]|jgi:hypothetical protein|nr:hypothetical protein [Spirochaetales bacterium]
MMILVKDDAEKNEFNLNIKEEGEGLTYPREYLEQFSSDSEKAQ